jgi:hypothetical protein
MDGLVSSINYGRISATLGFHKRSTNDFRIGMSCDRSRSLSLPSHDNLDIASIPGVPQGALPGVGLHHGGKHPCHALDFDTTGKLSVRSVRTMRGPVRDIL